MISFFFFLTGKSLSRSVGGFWGLFQLHMVPPEGVISTLQGHMYVQGYLGVTLKVYWHLSMLPTQPLHTELPTHPFILSDAISNFKQDFNSVFTLIHLCYYL